MADVDVLNSTLRLENFGIAAYDAALASGLLDGPTLDAAQAFRSDHVKHRELICAEIAARGGMAVSPLSAEEYAKAFRPLPPRPRSSRMPSSSSRAQPDPTWPA